jgi:nicotinate-nucleotide adenylyltransferase
MKRADEDIAPSMHDDILPGLSDKVDIVDVPMLSMWLSSTYVVERIRHHQSVRYLVPDRVLEYIAQNNLYQ